MTGSHRPRVSIGLPVYNGERFLTEVLECILGQTFVDYELIISDNASTDRTAQICQAYASRDERIRYSRNAINLGAASNFNRVFNLGCGEYFKWWAADDLCAPEYLARCVEALDQEPRAILAYSMAHCIDKDGNVVHSYETALCHTDWSSKPADRFRQLAEEFLYNGGSSAPIYVFGLMRSSMLRKTRLIGNYVASDWVILAEMALIGRFIELPQYLLFLRSHAGSSSLGEFRSQPEKVQEFFDPAVRGRLAVRVSQGRRYVEHFVIVFRSPLGYREKLFLLAYNITTVLRRVRRRLSGVLQWGSIAPSVGGPSVGE